MPHPETIKKKGEKTMDKGFVIVKHVGGDSGKYLFRVPKGVYLSAGDQVICDTAKGKDQPGVCCCDNFNADPEVVCPLFGTQPEKLKFVTGRIEYTRFAEEINEEEYHEKFDE